MQDFILRVTEFFSPFRLLIEWSREPCRCFEIWRVFLFTTFYYCPWYTHSSIFCSVSRSSSFPRFYLQETEASYREWSFYSHNSKYLIAEARYFAMWQDNEVLEKIISPRSWSPAETVIQCHALSGNKVSLCKADFLYVEMKWGRSPHQRVVYSDSNFTYLKISEGRERIRNSFRMFCIFCFPWNHK